VKERATQKDIKPDCINVPLDGSHYVDKFVSDHIIVTLDFIPVTERLPDERLKDKQCLCLSHVVTPAYRIIAGQFVKFATDCSHWAEIQTANE